jgi:hypothetical protein
LRRNLSRAGDPLEQPRGSDLCQTGPLLQQSLVQVMAGDAHLAPERDQLVGREAVARLAFGRL